MKDLKSAAKKIITNIINPPNDDAFGWPPSCTFILYEPERPVVKQEDETGTQVNCTP